MKLEKAGKANVIPTARAAWLTMNREGIRRLAAEELGLPTSPYRFADSRAELKAACEAVGFPCVVKPVMSSSERARRMVAVPEDGEAAWEYAAAGSGVDAGRVIVEGFIDFEYEITQLTVRAMDEHGRIATHFCEPIGHVQVNGDYVESWQPHPMPPTALGKARDIAKKITDNLGGLGIFGVELFVKGDMVWFSEVSPRPHDTGMVTMASQWQSEFEVHAKAILGLPVNVALKSPAASAVIYGQHTAKAIAFEGVAEALTVPRADIRLFGKPESFARRRMGVALGCADDIDTARRRPKEEAPQVKAHPARMRFRRRHAASGAERQYAKRMLLNLFAPCFHRDVFSPRPAIREIAVQRRQYMPGLAG